MGECVRAQGAGGDGVHPSQSVQGTLQALTEQASRQSTAHTRQMTPTLARWSSSWFAEWGGVSVSSRIDVSEVSDKAVGQHEKRTTNREVGNGGRVAS